MKKGGDFSHLRQCNYTIGKANDTVGTQIVHFMYRRHSVRFRMG